MHQHTKELTALDLFCGAGGLSYGISKAGFNVVAGVEYEEKIAKTYAANHPAAKLFVNDIRKITGKEILRQAGVDKIQLIAGCPPCQGFSKLTDKNHKPDPRNELVLEMGRIIEEVKPAMVMLENVPGLSTKGKPILDQFIQKLEQQGYLVTTGVLQMADYGVPQSRKRFVLLAGKGFSIPLPEPTHSKNGEGNRKPWLTLSDAIGTVKNRPVKLARAAKTSPTDYNWHVIRNLDKISIDRYKALRPGKSRAGLPKKLRPACHKNSNHGFQNVYGRLSWNKTPPTMTSGCTTPCMGRFGHPNQLRTLSVREAALVQTFPPTYKFETPFIETACVMVGNALPPKFAEQAGKTCMDAYLAASRS